MTTEPIFQNVGQALHVSFLMAILPVTQKVSTQMLLDALRQQSGRMEARVASTINMGGMSPLEFRGQCAMVTAAAHHHLPSPEYASVLARYGHQVTKAKGIASLADYCGPISGIENLLATKALLWSRYHRGSQRAQDRFSLRDIEKETGVSVQTLRTGATRMGEVCDGLERRAETRLEELFARTGLTPELTRTLQNA